MSNPPVPDYVPDWNPSAVYNFNGANYYAYEDGAVFYAKYYITGASNNPVDKYSDPYGPWQLVSGAVNTGHAAPAAPTGVTSSFTSDRLIALTWNPAHVPGSDTVTSYDIYQNGSKIGTSTSNHFTVTGLSGSTSYQFTVDAVDAVGVSPLSSAATITTTAPVISSGKVFSPYIDVGLDVDADMLSIARAMGHNDFTLAFLQDSVLASTFPASTGGGGAPLNGASISGNVLTVSNWTAGLFVAGYDISGAGVTPGTKIVSQISGTAGKNGAYQLSTSYGASFTTNISEHTVGWVGTGTIADDGFPINAALPNIQSVVQTLQSQGGAITISFGGSSGTDPAVAESNFAKAAVDAAQAGGLTHAQALAAVYAPYAAELQAEYQSVINRYGVTHLDFDIEGSAVANPDSFVMRDMALVALKAANPNLKISYTLPVLPNGLDNNGVSVLTHAAADGVHLDSVNIMAMDYGANAELAGDANGGLMAQDAIQAATATHTQIQAAGLTATVGITPMLGVNDDTSEIFTTANARTLEAWAATTPWVSSLGYWSVARDNDDAGQASLSDSGTPQTRWEFSSIFAPIAVAQGAHAPKGVDFAGDGRTDILFHNTQTGALLSWNGGDSAQSAAFTPVGNDWDILTGDFNGDGRTDLLFHSRVSSAMVVWDGGQSGVSRALAGVGNDWTLLTGDFDGDGKTDLLFHNKNDSRYIVWNGGDSSTAHQIGAAGNDWTNLVGDFNGDGKADLLFHNVNTGDLVVWNGGDSATSHKIGGVGTDWDLFTGDFDGDGKSDLLFHNRYSGQFVIWNGGDPSTSHADSGVGMDWTITTGDLDGDGRTDLVFHNVNTGAIVAWNGADPATQHQLGGAGAEWTMFG